MLRLKERSQTLETITESDKLFHTFITLQEKKYTLIDRSNGIWASSFSSSVLQQISSNGRYPLPLECHGLVDQIS